MDEMTKKLANVRFYIREMGEKIYGGEIKIKDIHKTKKKVNTILKEIEKMIKDGYKFK